MHANGVSCKAWIGTVAGNGGALDSEVLVNMVLEVLHNRISLPRQPPSAARAGGGERAHGRVPQADTPTRVSAHLHPAQRLLPSDGPEPGVVIHGSSAGSVSSCGGYPCRGTLQKCSSIPIVFGGKYMNFFM